MQVRDTLIQALGMGRTRTRTGAEGPHAYASEAGSCVRQVALSIMTDRSSDPPDLNSEVTFRVGRDFEVAISDAIRLQAPTAEFQVPWVNGLVSGVADAVYSEGPMKYVVEIKSCGLRTFQYVVGRGPKREHVLQAAMTALALNAHMLHIIYLCKAAPPESDPLKEYVIEVPWAETQAEYEALVYAVESAQRSVVPEPLWKGSVISTPDTKYGPCTYCPFIEVCRGLGPTAVEVRSVAHVRV